MGVGGRLFVRAAGDPYALVPAVTRIVREMSADQPVERAATLEDVRAEVLAPERLNAFVFSGFAGIALLIAVVGVAGVLAFSVSARTREFGVRLAIGSAPRHLLAGVLSEGVVIAAIGIAAGAAGGYVLAHVAAGFFETVEMPGVLPALGAAAVLVAAATLASLMPAARASRVDVMQALRSEWPSLTLIPSPRRRRGGWHCVGTGGALCRQGAQLHRKSGTIFVYAMLVMSLSGAVIAVGHAGTAMNLPAGLLTAYLIVTGLNTSAPLPGVAPGRSRRWCPPSRSAGQHRRGDREWREGNAGFVFPLVMFAACALGGGGRSPDDPRRRPAGAARIRRHFWRLCAALFIAAASFFLGPVRRIPEPLRIPALRLIPFVVLVTMVYWLWRYRRKRISPSLSASRHMRQLR